MANKESTVKKQLRDQQPILAMIDPKLGFTDGNTLLISRAAYNLLTKATADERKRIMQNAAAGIPMTSEEIKLLEDR